MITLRNRMRFTTPVFLGNATQNGQWRTPPFKALLRQWWRMVWAARGDPCDFAAMRREEGRLFGNAWLDGDFRKSMVRLRLDTWSEGKATGSVWEQRNADRKVGHPEVGQPIGALLYLGYGPLTYDKTKARGSASATGLKGETAIQAGEGATLSIAAPASDIAEIRDALALINAYGTVGGRSRNGWGSLTIEPLDGTPSSDRPDAQEPGLRFVQPWRDALRVDWPHAIGEDERGPLVWRTAEPCRDWKELMKDLAILKIGLRTMFVFVNARPPHPCPLSRHWLSYPVTGHSTRSWDGNLRLPNSLRFKVRPDREDPKRLRGVIFHVPCRPPPDFEPDHGTLSSVWETTHRLLDELTRSPGQRRYGMIVDAGRRHELKKGLDGLALQRSPE